MFPVKAHLATLTLAVVLRTTDPVSLRRLKKASLSSKEATMCSAFSFSTKLVKYIDQKPITYSKVRLRYVLH